MKTKTISFSISDSKYKLLQLEAECRGLTVSQYCKSAAFSHLSKYGSKGLFAEVIKRLGDGNCIASNPMDVGVQGKSPGGTE